MPSEIYTKIIEDILAECDQQNKKWGSQRKHDPFTWTVILVEEIGELAQAALHYRFGGPAAINLRTELIHVAAVTIQFLECFDRDNWTWNN